MAISLIMAASCTVIQSGSQSDEPVSSNTKQNLALVVSTYSEPITNEEYINTVETSCFKVRMYTDHAEIAEYFGDLESVDIPSKIQDKSVTVIGQRAFSDRATLEHVTLPNTVTNIKPEAFLRCAYLKDVTGGENIRTIEEKAFAQCIRLRFFPFAETTVYIGDSAFSWCESLESITIVANCNNIGNYAFRNCEGATSLVFEDSLVESIGTEAFMALKSLTELTYPYISGAVGEGIFKHGVSLKKINFDPRVTTVANRAFQRCEAIEELILPETITTVETLAFGSNSNLKNVIVLNNATSMDIYTFLQVYELTFHAQVGSTTEAFAQTKINNTYAWTFEPIED